MISGTSPKKENYNYLPTWHSLCGAGFQRGSEILLLFLVSFEMWGDSKIVFPVQTMMALRQPAVDLLEL
jgi:hypothetical protein